MMNKEKEETNYMLSYISSRTDDILADDYIGQIADYIINLQQENQQLKKQKDDVVEYIKKNKLFKYVYDEEELFEITTDKQVKNDLLRMLGEIDE